MEGGEGGREAEGERDVGGDTEEVEAGEEGGEEGGRDRRRRGKRGREKRGGISIVLLRLVACLHALALSMSPCYFSG